MKALLLNIAMALVWITVTATFTFTNLVFGVVLGYLLLWCVRRSMGPTTYFEKVWLVLKFAAFFIKEVLICNLRVAYDVITPRNHMRPAIVAVPLTLTSDAGITLLANMLTLTPGTCSLDISDDRKILYVHAMYVDDPEEFRRSIKQNYEARVQELLR